MKASDVESGSGRGAADRPLRRQWVGLLGWGLGRRLGLAGLLAAAIWAAVVWALA